MKTISPLVPPASVLLLLLAGNASAPAAQLRFELASTPCQWTLTYKNKPVMVYSFDPHQYKSYIKELHTTRGDNVLRDAPFDHLHHHALMYGIKVNGLNFWEEISGSGVQKSVKIIPPEIGTSPGGLPQARIVQVLNWVAPADAFLPDTNTPALLVETRTLTLTVNDKEEEVAVRWRSQFVLGTKTNEVTLTGANYHGLGMRFLQELDSVATHFTADGKPDVTGRQDVSAHAWEAVAFDAPGKPATIAVFGDAGNARGDTKFFAMKPFAYLSATQGLDKEPLVYRAGDKFELNYLITLYPALKSAPSLEERGKKWSSSKE